MSNQITTAGDENEHKTDGTDAKSFRIQTDSIIIDLEEEGDIDAAYEQYLSSHWSKTYDHNKEGNPTSQSGAKENLDDPQEDDFSYWEDAYETDDQYVQLEADYLESREGSLKGDEITIKSTGTGEGQPQHSATTDRRVRFNELNKHKKHPHKRHIKKKNEHHEKHGQSINYAKDHHKIGNVKQLEHDQEGEEKSAPNTSENETKENVEAMKITNGPKAVEEAHESQKAENQHHRHHHHHHAHKPGQDGNNESDKSHGESKEEESVSKSYGVYSADDEGDPRVHGVKDGRVKKRRKKKHKDHNKRSESKAHERDRHWSGRFPKFKFPKFGKFGGAENESYYYADDHMVHATAYSNYYDPSWRAAGQHGKQHRTTGYGWGNKQPTVKSRDSDTKTKSSSEQPKERKRVIKTLKPKAWGAMCIAYCSLFTAFVVAFCIILLILLIILLPKSDDGPGPAELEEESTTSFTDTTELATEENTSKIGTENSTDVGETWSDWTAGGCSVTCGIGIIARWRSCYGGSCDAPVEVDESSCYTGPCACSFFVANHLNVYTAFADGNVTVRYNTPGPQQALDLYYDPVSNSLFWTTPERELVRNGKTVKLFNFQLGGIIGDNGKKWMFLAAINIGIFRTDFSGQEHTFLYYDPTTKSEAMANIASENMIFWVNNHRRRVERLQYDGSGYITLHVYPSLYGDVTGVTADQANKIVYWIHKEDAVVFSIPYDGSTIPRILFAGVTNYIGEDLMFCLGDVYYTDPVLGYGIVVKTGINGQRRRIVNKSGIINASSLFLDN